MIELYYWPTPNGHKISIALEEMGLDYEIVKVNIGKGDQFNPDFSGLFPNNRMPAIIDHDGVDENGSSGQHVTILNRARFCYIWLKRQVCLCRRKCRQKSCI